MNIPGGTMLSKLGPRQKLALRLILGLGIIVALVASVDIEKLASVFGDVTWSLALPAILGLTAMHLISVLIWKKLSVGMIGTDLGLGCFIKVYYAAQAMGSLTPSNIGADAYRVYAVSKGNGGWKKALLPIATQRIISYFSLLIWGILAISITPLPSIAWKVLLVLVSLFTIGIIGFLILARSSSSTKSSLGRVARKLHLPTVWAEVRTRELRATLGSVLLLALIFHAGSILLSFILFKSAGGEGAIIAVLAALMLARLVIILPLPISGLGFQEGAIVASLLAIGIPAEIGLAVSLLNRLAFVQTILLGVVFILTGKIRLKENNPESIATTG